MLTIRKTETGDIDRVVELYEGAKVRMHSGGNPTQWAQGTPNRGTLERDMQNGNSYVVCREDGEVAGTFAYIIGADPGYVRIEGAWLNEEEYGTLHRVASDGVTKGITRAAVEYCLKRLNNLRIDTHRNNLPMRAAVAALGFSYCGIIHLNNGEADDARMAFQKTTLR